MENSFTEDHIENHIRWLELGHPHDAELLSAWLLRVRIAAAPRIPEELKPLVDRFCQLVEQYADEMIDALNRSGCPESFPLDDWTREFYRRHGRELPEGWR